MEPIIDRLELLIKDAPTVQERTRLHLDTLKGYEADMIEQINTFDWQFNTHDDPQLVGMLREAKLYCYHLLMNVIKPKEHPPYWLTLLGASETGKTHLAHAIYRFFKSHIESTFIPVEGFKKKQLRQSSGEFIMASEAGKVSINKHGYLQRINDNNLVIIDELDPRVSQLERDQICKLISWRAGAGTNPFKWTVLTANLTREQVADEFDPRIASRIRRGNNVVVELPEDITAFLDR